MSLEPTRFFPADAVLLVVLAGVAHLLVRALRVPAWRSWATPAVAVVVVSLIARALAPPVAGWIAAVAWGIAVLLPSRLLRAMTKAAGRLDFERASRLARIASRLLPGDAMRDQVAFTDALALAQRGRFDDAKAALLALGERAPALKLRVRLEALRLDNAIDEMLAVVREPSFAPRAIDDPGLFLLWIIALGSAGERDELVSVWIRHAPSPSKPEWRASWPLVHAAFYAFVGQRARVDDVFAPRGSDFSPGVVASWRAIAAIAAGEPEQARAIIEPHASTSDHILRRVFERTLGSTRISSTPSPEEATLFRAGASSHG